MADGGAKTGKKRKLLVALLTAPTVQAAAEVAGVPARTALRWRQEPAFKARLAALSRIQFDQTRTAARGLVATAVETLERNCGCGKPAAEIAAAGKLADIGLRAAELAEITARLDALAAAEAAGGKGQ